MVNNLDDIEFLQQSCNLARIDITQLWQAVNELRGKVAATDATSAPISSLNFSQVLMHLSNLESGFRFRRRGWMGELYADASAALELRVRWDSGKDCAYVPTNEDLFATDWMVIDA